MQDDEFKLHVTRELGSISGMVNNLDKKIDLHIQSTVYELKAIHRLDEQQNKLIDQHIEGVKTLKSIIDTQEKISDKRFADLEQPKKLLSMNLKILIAIGSIATAFTAIMIAMPYIKKLFE